MTLCLSRTSFVDIVVRVTCPCVSLMRQEHSHAEPWKAAFSIVKTYDVSETAFLHSVHLSSLHAVSGSSIPASHMHVASAHCLVQRHASLVHSYLVCAFVSDSCMPAVQEASNQTVSESRNFAVSEKCESCCSCRSILCNFSGDSMPVNALEQMYAMYQRFI